MEEIFGEIEDEHDSTNYIATQTEEGEYVLSARLEIEKVNELFSLDLPESDAYMTVGGLILHEYQSFPKLNEVVKIGKYEFKIIKNTMTKIEIVKLNVKEWKIFLSKIAVFDLFFVILSALCIVGAKNPLKTTAEHPW